MLTPSRPHHLLRGARYFVDGLKLLWHPQLRPYLLVPIAVNCVLFIGLTALLVHYYDAFITWEWQFPVWLSFLEKLFKWLAWFLVATTLIISYGYFFNVITNILAAPFYGLLAQRAELLLTGSEPPDESWAHMIPRTLGRELIKLWYFLVRGALVLLLMLLLATLGPLGVLAPVVGLIWGAWSMAIQYADYPADNHRTPFHLLRKRLRRRRYSSLGLGGVVMGASMIPVVNIFAMPAAVTGGTLLWVNELRHLRRVTQEG